jgi:hypothetical protein
MVIDDANMYRYWFNFCQNTVSVPCGDSNREAAGFKEKIGSGDGPDCLVLTDSDYEPMRIMTQDSKYFNASTNIQDSTNRLVFGLEGGDECNSQPSSLSFIIDCDSSIEGRLTTFNVDNSDECNPIIRFSHKAGCPITKSVVLVQRGYLTDRPFVLAISLLVVGLFMLFYGRK